MFRITINAHVIGSEAAAELRAAMSNVALSRSKLDLSEDGIEGAITRYGDGIPTPDMLIVETPSDAEETKEQLGRLSAVTSDKTDVVLIGKVDSIDFYREIMDLGVAHYMVRPISAASILRAVSDVYSGPRAITRGRVIAVFGAKGGVGASTVAHNLAWALADTYKRPVSLVDLDLHFGTVSIDYNHENRFGLRDALLHWANNGSVDEVFLERLFSRETDNLWLLASSPAMTDVGDQMKHEAVEAIVDVVARMSEFVVLDIPHVWTPAIDGALLSADETVIVTEPSLVGLRNAQLVFEHLAPNKPYGTALRHVVNGAGLAPSDEIVAKDFSEAIGSAALATVPWSPAVFRAASAQGRMIGDARKNGRIAAIFTDMARAVSGKRPDGAGPRKGGMLNGMFGGVLGGVLGGRKPTPRTDGGTR